LRHPPVDTPAGTSPAPAAAPWCEAQSGDIARRFLNHARTALLAAGLLVPTVALAAIGVNKTFNLANVSAGQTSTLTVILINNNPAAATATAFTDTLPGTVVIATPANAANTCGGGVTAVSGATSFSFSGGTIPAAVGLTAGQCTVQVDVVSPTAGVFVNTIPPNAVTSSQGNNTQTASATLTVATLRPVTGAKTFNPTVLHGSTTLPAPTSRITVTLTNPNGVALTNASLTDTLPAGISIAPAPNPTTTCGAGTLSTTANSATLAGGTIPANLNCNFQFDVVATNPNAYANGAVTNTIPISALATAQGVTNTAAFSANVTLQTGARVEKTFAPTPITTGGTSTLTVTVRNFNTSPLTNVIGFTDNMPAGMTVAAPVTTGGSCLLPPGTLAFTPVPIAGAASFTVSGGSLPGATVGVNSNANCTVTIGVTGINAGVNPLNLTNTIPVGNFGGVAYSSAAGVLAVNQVTNVTASKAFVPAAVVQGGTSVLTVTLNNAAAVAASLTAVFTDSLASMGAGYTIAAAPAGATTCGGALTAVPGATSFSLPIGTTIPAAGSCTITIPVQVAANAVTGGRVNTIAQSVLQTTQGRTQFPTTATLTTSAALVVAKAFAPATVAALGTSRLTVTLTHANGAPAFTGLAFTDNLPAGHTIAATPNAVTTCGGVVTAVSGSSLFSMAGGALGAGATSCTVAVNITTPAGPGVATNTIPATTGVTTTEGFVNAAAATATITRAVTNVVLNKSFNPATTLVGGVSRMTINILNTGANALALTATSLTDLLPVGMVIAAVPPNPAPTNSCGGVLTATPGTATISIANGSIAANATCAIAVSVVTNASGNLINTLPAGTFTSAQGVSNPLPALATLAATGSADLQVTKTDGTLNAVPGTTTTYTIVARNNGPQTVAGATFTDTPPAGMAFTAWTCVASAGSACGNANGSGPINEPVTLLLNGTATYTVTASIAPNATGTITNTATIVVPGTVIDTNLANNTASDTDTLTRQADLAISKTDGAVSAVAGASTVYTIVVSNNGPSSVVGASIADVMPAAIVGDTFTAVATGGATGFTAVGAGNINDTVNMPAGSTITYTVTANINSGASGNLVNTATVTAPAGVTDTNPGNNSATDSDALTRQADLTIIKTDGRISVIPGGTTTYTVTVGNSGPSSVVGAAIADIIPAAIQSDTFTAVGAGGASGFTANGAGNINDTVNMPAGSTIVYTIVANIRASATGTLVNTATVTPPGGVIDPTPGNNTSADTDSLTPQADLSVTKTDNVASVVPGGSTTYTIVVTNNGPSNVTAATIADIMPAGITSDTYTAVATLGATGFTANGSGNINDTVTMPAGSTITYTVVADISASANGTLVNTATVTPPGGVTDPTPGNNSATDTDTLAAQVTLAVVKTDGSANYTPGGTAVYLVTVANSGASDALNVTVTDLLPPGLTLTANVSCTANGNATCGPVIGSIGGTSFSMTNGIVGAGMGNSLVFTVPVAFAPSMTANPLQNTATATDIATGSNASDTDSDALAPQVSLSVAKSDGSATYTPGGSATYTLTITNGGLSNATNVTINDPLPAGVTLTANATCAPTGAANCGTVTGTIGQGAFGTTGAQITAGAGNALVFTAPVAFAPGLATDPLDNTATAQDVLSGASGFATDTNMRAALVTLAVSKTDGSATYTPGTGATYLVGVANTGVSDALNVTIGDTLPVGVTLSGAVTCVATGIANCGIVTGIAPQTSFGATGAQVSAGAGNSLAFTVPVSFAASLADNPLLNTATANDLASGANGSATDSDTLAAQADLAMTKTDGVGSVAPGTTTTYTIVVTNNGPGNVAGATVTDVMPAAIISDNFTAVGSGGAAGFTAAGAGNINDTVSMPPGSTITYTVVADISAGAAGNLVNTATAAVPAGMTDTNPANNSATDTDTLSAQVDLSITKSDGTISAAPGTATTYTIVVANNGPSDVVGAAISDVMPAAIASANFTAAGNGGASGFTAAGAGNINDTVNMPSGSTITYTVVANISASATGNLVNTATVAPPAGVIDTNPGNNSATDTDTLTATADLSITKTDGVVAIAQGGSTTYVIVVANSGPSAVVGATVSDVLPAAFASATFTAVGNGGASGFTANGVGSINDTVALPAGSTITYTLNASLNAGALGNVANTATVAAPGGVTDPTPGNNSATDTDTVTATPTADLGITKSDASPTYTPGSAVTYSIVASNAGPAPALGATVIDVLPVAIAGATWTCVGAGGGTCPAAGAGNINANVNLPAGASVTFTLTGNVAAGAAGNLVNTATIAVPPGIVDPNPGNNSATDTDAPASAAGLAITKTDGSATYSPGGTGTYTITVTNNGPSNANNMIVTDNLPAGVTLTGNATCVAAGAATCGVVAGAAGGTVFTATGATIAAGAGNRLVYTLPVKFAIGMTTNPLVNIATASDPASASVASASDGNAIATAGPAPVVNPVPIDSRWALMLLAGLIVFATWRRSYRRNS